MKKENVTEVNNEQDLLGDDYSLGTIPEDQKSSLGSLTMVWLGFTVSISAFLLGGTLGTGLTATRSIIAVFIGNFVLMAIASTIGIYGARTGLTTYSIARMIFGKKGSIISSTVLGILGMALIGVLMDSFGDSVSVLLPGIPKTILILIFAIAITSSAIFGYRGLKVLSAVAIPLLWLLLGITLYRAIGYSDGIGAIFNAQPAAPMTMAAAISLVIADWANGAVLSADISRYAKKPSHVIIASSVGFLLGTSFFVIVSVLATIGTGNADFTQVLIELGLLKPGVLIILLALWTTTDNNVYSSSLAFRNMGDLLGVDIPKWIWTIVCVAIAFVASNFGLADNFGVWLGYLGAATTPFAGILLSHFLILNRNNKRLEIPTGFRASALIAWGIGFGLTRLVVVNQASIPIPSTIMGIIVGAILYVVLSKIMDKDFEAGEVEYFEYK